jgi:cytoplasmic iron level regulating protein YaaA (DUF328/UPF0246 family)
MIAIVSPAKTQDFQLPIRAIKSTQIRLATQTLELVEELRSYSQKRLVKLMNVSEKLAEVNFGRYKNFQHQFNEKNARQAILAFQGDVYTDIEAENYSDEDFEFAQAHFRMLSGLYGMLRPLDMMQPYRLEMKTKLKTKAGKNLYDFWGSGITELLNDDIRIQGDDILVNLASEEYFKAIDTKVLKARIITPVFKEKRGKAEPKLIALFAKRARGTMSNFIIKNRIQKPEQLRDFTDGGYRFESKGSNEETLIFIRQS